MTESKRDWVVIFTSPLSLIPLGFLANGIEPSFWSVPLMFFSLLHIIVGASLAFTKIVQR